MSMCFKVNTKRPASVSTYGFFFSSEDSAVVMFSQTFRNRCQTFSAGHFQVFVQFKQSKGKKAVKGREEQKRTEMQICSSSEGIRHTWRGSMTHL